MDWEHDGRLLKSLWSDWACPENQLVRRARKLMPVVQELARSPWLEPIPYGVFFKNIRGTRASGEEQIHIVPLNGKSAFPRYIVVPPRRKGGKASYGWTESGGKEIPPLKTGSWEDVLDFFRLGFRFVLDYPSPFHPCTLGKIMPGKSVRKDLELAWIRDKRDTFKEYLKTQKPVIAMLHLAGGCRSAKVSRALRETEIYLRNGVDAVLVENYYGNGRDCEAVLKALQERMPEAVCGVNVLRPYDWDEDDAPGDGIDPFLLATQYDAKFIQIDSVCGHLPPDEDEAFARELAMSRALGSVPVLGGVRFKYQPVRSMRSLEEDLRLGMQRCDAIVVTGEGTGKKTPMEKIREFRKILGDFPLIAGAGLTADTVRETLSFCDGAIVGSWFMEGHEVGGVVREEYVREFMKAARWIPEEASGRGRNNV